MNAIAEDKINLWRIRLGEHLTRQGFLPNHVNALLEQLQQAQGMGDGGAEECFRDMVEVVLGKCVVVSGPRPMSAWDAALAIFNAKETYMDGLQTLQSNIAPKTGELS